MKRFTALAALLVLVVALVGCGGPPVTTGTGGSSNTSATAPAGTPYTPISTDGPQESKAAAALPAALKTAAGVAKTQDRTLPDLSGANATLVSYVLQAQVGDQIALFDVRADGRAYELYKYPVAPSPQKLSWQPAGASEGAALADPASNLEREAVAAVTSVVKTAKPGSEPTVKITGYVFYWIGTDHKPVTTDGGAPFNMTIDPAGHAAAWAL